VLSIVNKRISYILNIGIVPLECCESRENCASQSYFLNFLKDIIDVFLNRVLNK